MIHVIYKKCDYGLILLNFMCCLIILNIFYGNK